MPRPRRVNASATVVIVTAVVLAIVLGVLAYGYWDSYIRPARATAVAIGDREYDMIFFTRRMRTALKDPAFSGSQQQVVALPTTLAQDILDEEALVQRAGTLGVSVSDDEIDQSMAEQLRTPFTKDDAGHIQRTPSFENAVRNYLQRGDLTLAQFRRSVHGQRLRQAVRRHFEDAIPEALPAALIRQITLGDEAKAKEVKQRLDGGADFAAEAAQNSTDSATRGTGGLRDWTAKGLLPAELDTAAFSLPIGQPSDPIKTGAGYTIIRVEERTDSRQVADKDRSALAARQLDDWLKQTREDLGARNYMDRTDRLTYAISNSGAREAASRNQPANPGRPSLPPINLPPGQPPGGGAPGAPPSGGGGNP